MENQVVLRYVGTSKLTIGIQIVRSLGTSVNLGTGSRLS